MKKSSWCILFACIALAGLLGFAYVQSERKPAEVSTVMVTSMLDYMKSAVEHKNVHKLMEYVDQAQDTRISHLNNDQLRILLSRSFNQSEKLDANYSNVDVRHRGDDATAEFDLLVSHHMGAGDAEDYKGHITLHLRIVPIAHLLGLYHTHEWRIFKADTDGPDLAGYGDY